MPNKLVRDNIPDIIKKAGKIPITHIANEQEYLKRLIEKLQEEVNEFIDNKKIEELADILEVIYAISNFKNYEKKDLEILREKVAKEKGGYKNKIVLDKIE